MASTSVIRYLHFLLAGLVFLIILASYLFVGFLLQDVLHDGKHPLDDSRLFMGTVSALFATPLIGALFFRARRLVSESKDRELFMAKKDLENTFNTMTDFVSVHDRKFTITRVNKSLCEFLGKAPEEMIGKQCYQVFHNRDEPYENCPHRRIAELDHPVTEIINDMHLGVPLQITCAPFFDDEGVFLGSLHVARASEETGKRSEKKPGALLPICASCKSIRNGENTWSSPEEYFMKKYETRFTHTLCRGCQEILYPNFIRGSREGGTAL